MKKIFKVIPDYEDYSVNIKTNNGCVVPNFILNILSNTQQKEIELFFVMENARVNTGSESTKELKKLTFVGIICKYLTHRDAFKLLSANKALFELKKDTGVMLKDGFFYMKEGVQATLKVSTNLKSIDITIITTITTPNTELGQKISEDNNKSEITNPKEGSLPQTTQENNLLGTIQEQGTYFDPNEICKMEDL